MTTLNPNRPQSLRDATRRLIALLEADLLSLTVERSASNGPNQWEVWLRFDPKTKDGVKNSVIQAISDALFMKTYETVSFEDLGREGVRIAAAASATIDEVRDAFNAARFALEEILMDGGTQTN